MYYSNNYLTELSMRVESMVETRTAIYVKANVKYLPKEDAFINTSLTYANHYLDCLSQIVLKRKYLMASKNTSKKNLPAQWTMVEVNLTSQERIQFKQWYADNAGDLELHVNDMLSNNYKLSLSYSLNNTRFYASLTAKDEEQSDYGVTLVSHANTFTQAIALTFFKWSLLLDGVLKARESTMDEDFG